MADWFGTTGECHPERLSGWPKTIPPFVPRRTPTLLAAPNGSLAIARTPTASSRDNRYDIVDRQGQLTEVVILGPGATLIGFGANSAYVVVTDDLGLQTLERHPWP